MPAPTEPWAAAVVPRLGLERRGAKLYRPGAAGSLGEREHEAIELEARLGLEPVKVDDAELARFLEQQGRLVRAGDGYAVSPAAYQDARDVLVAELESAGRITLARYRDLLGVSRKTAQLLAGTFRRRRSHATPGRRACVEAERASPLRSPRPAGRYGLTVSKRKISGRW